MRALQLAAAGLFVLGAHSTHAQGREPLRRPPETIPTELALALLSGTFGSNGEPQLLVGEMPEWVASRLALPMGTRVVGSAFAGNVVQVVISIPIPQDSAAERLDHSLRQGGWGNPPQLGFPGGGFRPAPSELIRSAGPSRSMLCREEQMLTYWRARDAAMSTNFVLRVSSGPSVCDRSRIQAQIASYQQAPLPTLFNPPGSGDPYANSRCGQLGSHGTQTELRTELTPTGILEHYGRQLQDSGWTPVGGEEAIAGAMWTRPDSLGTPRTLSLTVITSPKDARCRAVRMDVERPQRER